VLLQLECVANASFMKDVCEVWNISSYCGITSDSNSLQFEAEVPLGHTVQLPSEVCLFSDLTRGVHWAWVRDSLELMECRHKIKRHLCHLQ
jgi:hypothetical protein